MANTVIQLLEELESTQGKNARLEILEVNRKNDLLKRAFVAAQDPYTVYYVNKFKMPAPLDEPVNEDDEALEVFMSLLNLLSKRKLTGNAAKDAVTEMFSECNELQQKWFQRIILKNLRCGLQESSVNKIWPGTMKSFTVALACTLKSDFIKGEGIKILDKVTYPVRVEPKLDGLRCIAVKKDGVVTFFTRNGTILESMPKIKAALEDTPADNFVLDGEGMAADWNESSSVMMSKTQKDDSGLVYNVFDAMSLADWVAQECCVPYEARTVYAEGIIGSMSPKAPVKQVPHIMAKNESELKAYFSKCMDEGFEGVMLKTLDTPYIFKRSENILKLKPCVTYEGIIVGHYEGRHGTKREGLFGGFEVVLPNGKITRLGGGFNDALKAQVQLEGPDTYLGKIVELEAQPDPLTSDGLTVDGKARFPVFCRFRDEGDVDPKVIDAGVKFFEELPGEAE